jgi:hypothetical protein
MSSLNIFVTKRVILEFGQLNPLKPITFSTKTSFYLIKDPLPFTT